MKRTKRKYTRKATTGEIPNTGFEKWKSDYTDPSIVSEESKSSGIETEGSTITLPEVIEPTVKAFSYDDLPLSIRMSVESQLAYRKRLGLPDDSKERKAQAIKYFRGDKVR